MRNLKFNVFLMGLLCTNLTIGCLAAKAASDENLNKVLNQVCISQQKIDMGKDKNYLYEFIYNYMPTERSARISKQEGDKTYIYTNIGNSMCLKITATSCEWTSAGPGNPATQYVQLDSGYIDLTETGACENPFIRNICKPCTSRQGH